MSESNARHQLVAEEIREQAVRLFSERGFASTSLQDVAQAIGISRTALYHYISSKEQLLVEAVEGLTAGTAKALVTVESDTALTPPQKIENAIREMVIRITESPARFFLLDRSQYYLPGDVRRQNNAAMRSTLESVRSIVQQGMADGSFAQVSDSTVAAFSVIGMCQWLAWWYDPEGSMKEEDIVTLFTDVCLSGLCSSAGTEAPSRSSAISVIREQLRILESLE